MPEYCTCGAELPPDARFCHKCGKPQRDEPLIQEPPQEPPPRFVPPPPAPARIGFHNSAAVRVAFFTGLIANLLTAVLVFGCPLWLFGAGLLAVQLYARRTGEALTTENGARLGWIAGLFSFVTFAILFTVQFVAEVRSGDFERNLREQLQQWPFLRAHLDQAVELMRSPGGMAMHVLFSLFVMFVIFTMFAMLGGVLGAKLSRGRHSPPPATP